MRKTGIALFVVIILAGITWWVMKSNTGGTIRKELYDFAIEDTAAITKIYLANTSGKQILLERGEYGFWQLNGKFKARPDATRNLLQCIRDLEVRQPVAKAAVENVSRQLATGATKVEIYQGEKKVKQYYVGSDTQDGLGTFMLLTDLETGENSSLPFVMFIPGFNGFLSIRYFTDESLWRDRTVFAFYPDQITSVNVHYNRLPDSSFTLELNKDLDISLFDSKGNNMGAYDTLQARQYITYYTNINYEALKNDLPKALKDSILGNQPVHIIKLQDKLGREHVVKTYAKPAPPSKPDPLTGEPLIEDPEHMFALVNDGNDLALIQFYVFGKLFPGPAYFKPKKSAGVVH